MKMIELKCPNCNAQLSTKNDKRIMFCEYCGTKIALDDGNSSIEITKNINITKKNINVDEAKIEEAKTERVMWKGWLLFLIFDMLLLVGIGIWSDYGTTIQNYFLECSTDEQDIILMPGSSDSYKYENANDVGKELEEAGFEHIEYVKDTYDSFLGSLLGKYGEVLKVEINNKEVEAGKKYNKNDTVIIYYYAD